MGRFPPGKLTRCCGSTTRQPASKRRSSSVRSIGPCAEGVQDGMIIARPLDQINPVHLVLQADTVPIPKALADFFPRSPVPHSVFSRALT